MPNTPLRVTRTVLDSLAFSGIWTAFAAATLIGASGVFLQPPWGPAQLGLACGLGFAGTMTVYAFDRVRDIQRDQASSPSRSAFVARHQRSLLGVSAAGLSLSLAAAWALPPITWLLCAGVGAMGLLHRRLKNRSPSAWVYVSAAWVGITVGLPALIAAPDAISLSALLTLTLCWALAIGSNALASERRGLLYDAQAATQMRRARRWALASAVTPLILPGSPGLAAVGIATWLATLFFRPEERYGLIVLDGALVVGGGLAVAWMIL